MVCPVATWHWDAFLSLCIKTLSCLTSDHCTFRTWFCKWWLCPCFLQWTLYQAIWLIWWQILRIHTWLLRVFKRIWRGWGTQEWGSTLCDDIPCIDYCVRFYSAARLSLTQWAALKRVLMKRKVPSNKYVTDTPVSCYIEACSLLTFSSSCSWNPKYSTMLSGKAKLRNLNYIYFVLQCSLHSTCEAVSSLNLKYSIKREKHSIA